MCVIDYKNMADFCSGCGVCAGICPNNNIVMRVNEKGDLRAYKSDHCNSKCDLCQRVCPILDTRNMDHIAYELFSSELNMNYNDKTGYFTNCYVGHVNNENERLNSASGGLASWLLRKLLEDDLVDRIIAVKPSPEDSNNLFKFGVFDNLNDVSKSSSSAYYPVEISEAIKKIINDGELRYAIIGLPCVVFGIRQAQKINILLRNRIKCVFSLTCGQMMNRFYPEFIGAKGGLSPSNIAFINYRNKHSDKNAANFRQIAFSRDGKKGAPIIYSSTYLNWKYCFFTHKSCLACDDFFGELADATFMDAWLPEYYKDWKGNTIVLSRNNRVDKLISNGIKLEECSIEPLSIDLVIDSQLNRIKDRKITLRGRLYYLEQLGVTLHRRIKPEKRIYKQNKKYINLCFKICDESKKVWASARLKSESIKYLTKEMKYLNLQIQLNEKKSTITNILKNKIFKNS